MTRFLLGGAAAAAILAIAPAMAQTPPPAAHPGARNHVMKPETRADAQAAIAKHFARLDANRDGFVSKAEIDAVQAVRSAKLQQRAEQRAQRFDPAKAFARLDSNKDGKITQAEADAAHAARVAAKGGQPAKANATASHGLFARADTNKDGIITRAEFDAGASQMRARIEHAGLKHADTGRMFETADANKDGRVSLIEMQQAALQHFDRADLNHDGTLTPEERRQAHQLLRGQRKPS